MKCNECKKQIKGKIAYKDCKPYCSVCFRKIKQRNKHKETFLWITAPIGEIERR